MAKAKTAGSSTPANEVAGARGVDMKGKLHVSELISDRAAAPSPFGDDQTFPLPVESLSYRAASRHP
ncbi:hypothetical protein GCM10010112_36780 [Actinoplanes lobatus]|uniref:Uncharacterized protein n=1 Tax=Actinoplanes lobatus TaxID=113568 RepID=A0A7W7HCY7_9ACTN|nr:hypothetical protein [Actinoplanes lobatus]MBB4748241.1 hypothetical protein [Actinoplanes lobatus]GGN70342.1 hypothetical protein GCM10010112_36780 [Actinoplanes lobatus]GIE40090.1 hypothetical protein Alo02nite_29880 [Actinoplanes lobatus]